jgi:hypothetical protein
VFNSFQISKSRRHFSIFDLFFGYGNDTTTNGFLFCFFVTALGEYSASSIKRENGVLMWASAKSAAWSPFGRFPPCRPVDGLFAAAHVCSRVPLKSSTGFGRAVCRCSLFSPRALSAAWRFIAFAFRVRGCEMDGRMARLHLFLP